ncbi:MAG: DUF393 domain-containing protein [Oceanicaulis sp.]
MDQKTQTATEQMQLTQGEARPQVYFDGACPLCRAEIGLYQRQGAEAEFIDISRGEGAPEEVGCDAALKRFHVRRSDARLLSGAAAFAELWKATPGWRWLGRIGAVPPFVWIGEGLYRAFLVIRPAIQNVARKRAG